MELKDVIRTRRNQLNMTLEYIGRQVGVGKSTVAKWERGEITNIRRDNIEKLARVLRVSPLVLMGREELPNVPQGFEPMPQIKEVPRVGRIACGIPVLAEQNIEEYDKVPAFWKADFTLLCVGDSMAPKILDGDLVAIRQQETIENGQIAAILIDNEATLKRVYTYPDKVILSPINPDYEPIILTGPDMQSIRIEGKAVGFCRNI